MDAADSAEFRPFLGLGPRYTAAPSKATFARVIERLYWCFCASVAIGVSVWLAPYWGFRILLVASGLYLPLAGALVEKMEAQTESSAKNVLWRVGAYGGLLFALIAFAYNHWQTRDEFLFWKYKWTDPQQLSDLKFDFANPPEIFSHTLAKQMFPGQPLRCMQYFPNEMQYQFGTDECYFWTGTFNGLPGKMSEFLFTKDRLNAVRIEFPLWQTSNHYRAIVARHGEPYINSKAILDQIGGARMSGLGLLALSQAGRISVWMLPSGVLMADAQLAWKEPYGLMFWLSKDWFCKHRTPGTDSGLGADAYCAK